jgi:hypothetical protein
MLALRNFLRYGINWAGDEADIQFLLSRSVQVILASLADLTNAKNPSAGVKSGRPGLSGFVYKKSTVSVVLKKLIELKILTRCRAPRQGGIGKILQLLP